MSDAKHPAQLALARAADYLFPGTQRGPADDEWIEVMREVARALHWPPCPECQAADGLSDVCAECYGVGFEPGDDEALGHE